MAALLAVLQERDRVFIVHRARMSARVWPEVWPSDDPAPILVITIGGKEAKP